MVTRLKRSGQSMHRQNPVRGQIAVMFALLLPVLLGISGLVIDGGAAMVNYRRGQVALDSAALAAATRLNKDEFTETNTVDLEAGSAYYLSTSYAFDNAHGILSITGIEVTGAQVVVYGTVSSPTVFMRIFGINQVRLHLSSRAELKYGITEEGQ